MNFKEFYFKIISPLTTTVYIILSCVFIILWTLKGASSIFEYMAFSLLALIVLQNIDRKLGER